ncbi:hypothetical protein O9929_05670 [Vibrio lentus]|nr:hypothetical protein [Vibrio lentus]
MYKEIIAASIKGTSGLETGALLLLRACKRQKNGGNRGAFLKHGGQTGG